MLTSCSDDITDSTSPDVDDFVSTPVLFSAGNQSLESSRATTLYMPNNVRFSAAMYYQESSGYNLTPWLAFLQVNDASTGKSNYRQYTFAEPASGKADDFGNDLDAHIFYWQNRQKHIFIGYIDNYNAAYASAMAADQTYIPDNLGSHNNFPIYNDDKGFVRNQMCKHFDLRNPKDAEGNPTWTKMSDQYDPLIACEEKQPTGAGGETNRVYLTFKHQFSQIQVNLKGHESVNLIPEQIDAVEMLGVSESADVFPFVDYKGVVDPETPTTQEIVTYDNPQYGTSPSYIRTAEAGKVDLTQYTPEQQEANPYGTIFDMFKANDVSTGYLKRFEAIAYGQLQALRIHWHELDETRTDKHGIDHVVTFVIPDATFRELKSGRRSVFNLEIRRGTLAVVRAEIDNWVPYETVYYEDGTIEKN